MLVLVHLSLPFVEHLDEKAGLTAKTKPFLPLFVLAELAGTMILLVLDVIVLSKIKKPGFPGFFLEFVSFCGKNRLAHRPYLGNFRERRYRRVRESHQKPFQFNQAV